MVLLLVSLTACPGSVGDDALTGAEDPSSSSTGPGQPATDSGESTESEPGDTTESPSSETSETGETGTGTETGEMCTDESCSSLLTMTFAHSLALLEGPHALTIQTPLHELLCSIDPEPSGRKSCFGFMFTDLVWDEQTITVLLTAPYYDTDLNPEATPFESVSVLLELGDMTLYDEMLPVEPGDPIQPDPCGEVCWHATVDASFE